MPRNDDLLMKLIKDISRKSLPYPTAKKAVIALIKLNDEGRLSQNGNSLNSAFTWFNTSEGDRFWRDINNAGICWRQYR